MIELLKEMDPSANCFHLISDTLVEHTVGGVLPFLEKNLGNVRFCRIFYLLPSEFVFMFCSLIDS